MKAFPSPHDPKTGTMQLGMELRDYFAAQALQVFYRDLVGDESKHPDSVAYWCYLMADAMMKARDK